MTSRIEEKNLFNAIRNKNIERIKILISKDIDLNVFDRKGYSPLLYAISSNSPEIVELLIRKGADINVITKDGLHAILWVAKLANLYEEEIAYNQYLSGEPDKLAWKDNLIEIARLVIGSTSLEGLRSQLDAIRRVSTRIYAVVLENLGIKFQLAELDKLNPDECFKVLEQIGYFPLIDMIPKHRAEDILFRLPLSQRSLVTRKMKDPPPTYDVVSRQA